MIKSIGKLFGLKKRSWKSQFAPKSTYLNLVWTMFYYFILIVQKLNFPPSWIFQCPFQLQNLRRWQFYKGFKPTQYLWDTLYINIKNIYLLMHFPSTNPIIEVIGNPLSATAFAILRQLFRSSQFCWKVWNFDPIAELMWRIAFTATLLRSCLCI